MPLELLELGVLDVVGLYEESMAMIQLGVQAFEQKQFGPVHIQQLQTELALVDLLMPKYDRQVILGNPC